MRIKDIWVAGIFAAAALCASIRTVGAAEVLYDASGFVQGQQSFVDSFYLSDPGTLTITLSNIAWPQALAELDLLVSNANGAIAPEMSAGTESFNITGGGRYFAQWFGVAQGPLDLGVYGISMSWQPVTSVPLPASLSLLLSGLAFLWLLRRHNHLT